MRAFLGSLLIGSLFGVALLGAAHLGNERRCDTLLKARDTDGLVEFCDYDIWEDGSGVQYDRKTHKRVRVFPADYFPWDCRTMGNHLCGPAL